MRRYSFVTIAGILLLCRAGGSAQSQLAVEDLWAMDVPSVVSVSKRPQVLTYAPATVSVVTGEELRQMGVTHLAEALRYAIGVDARQVHASQHVLGIRGFTDTGHVLITIDGNNAFLYHANHIFLDWAPVDILEVERVEIVRGPGSVFHGGNASSGTINIITRPAPLTPHARVRATGGTQGTAGVHLLREAQLGSRWSYRLSLAGRRAEEWTEPDLAASLQQGDLQLEAEDYHVLQGGLRLFGRLPQDRLLSVDLRTSAADHVISRVCNPVTVFASVRLEGPKAWIRAFRSGHDKDFWDGIYTVSDENVEIEAMRVFESARQALSVGGYAKSTRYRVTDEQRGTAEAHRVWDVAVHAETQYRLRHDLQLALGGRLERYTGLAPLGMLRASALHQVTTGLALRATVASGYYLPSLLQSTNEGRAYPLALGNPDLEAEGIRMLELALSLAPTPRLQVEAAAFANRVTDRIDSPATTMAVNADGVVWQRGVEAGLSYALTPAVTWHTNGTVLRGGLPQVAGPDPDPAYRVNSRLLARWGPWSGWLQAQAVGAYGELYATANPVFGRIGAATAPVSAYRVLDARIAHRAGALEFGILAQNLLQDDHYESNRPGAGVHGADPVGRRFLLQAEWHR